MNDKSPLYNSRIFRTYIEYIGKYYPEIDVESIFEFSGISKDELEDPGHWVNQAQADKFYEGLLEKTGNPNLAREAGQYTASSESIGAVKQYSLSLISMTSVYLLMGRIYALMSKGATIAVQKIGKNKIELISRPAPGVNEKPYQCENRLGTLESVTKLFTNQLAQIEHPTCFHRGDDCCRYIISWHKTRAVLLKKLRNYSLVVMALASIAAAGQIPTTYWTIMVLSCGLISSLLSVIASNAERKELISTIETQGDAAGDLIDEINARYNDTLMVHEIGQATSTIMDKEKLPKIVIEVMKNHLDYDRGMIMLANKDRSRLIYAAGYGYSSEQEELLRNTKFHLDRSDSQGMFVLTFNKKKPILVNDFSQLEERHSERSQKLAQIMSIRSLICVPIVYEKESLGIIVVDNVKSKRTLTKSDTNLLMSIASQMAVGITNASSFELIQASEEKYRDLVENANSIILRLDTKGNITFFNEFAQNFFGYTEEEILGKNIIGTIIPARDSSGKNLSPMIKNMMLYPDLYITNELDGVLRNGERVVITWTNKTILDADNNIEEILCIGNNVTELRKAEEEKKLLQVRLQRAQKMEALGTLAGGVAHDLNNILVGLVSYPELLLMQLPDDSHLRKPIGAIQRSGEKAAAIVQDLLTLARRGVATTEVINLNTIITDYMATPEFEKLKVFYPGVKIDLNLDDELLNILGSPVHLSKTIMNLVSNAAEAISEEGTVTIFTKNSYIDENIGSYDTVNEGDYVLLAVQDTGIGIPEEDQDRIFEPFYTKKVMGRSGTGLGLAVVWGTTKDHNGYIDVKSTEGKGTTVSLYFPVTRKEAAEEKRQNHLESILGKGESIVVVDDIEEQREIASSILTKLGYSVKVLSSGEEAIDYLSSNPVDLLVLDMIMDPGIDGYETYKRINELNPEQKTIIVSGFSESERVKKAQLLGAGTYVRKPYLMETIGKAVRNELDR